jgi:hypothetical protein
MLTNEAFHVKQKSCYMAASLFFLPATHLQEAAATSPLAFKLTYIINVAFAFNEKKTWALAYYNIVHV